MANITVLGVDIAKNVFELCGLDDKGHKCIRRTVKRKDFVRTVIQLQPKLVAMEACNGANHWYRMLTAQGIAVGLISPQYVKPFVKTNKNDSNDAEGIAIAGSQGTMHFVSPKSLEQQDIQSLLRVRERLKINRVKLINEARGLLQEYGVVISKGAHKFYQEIASVIDDEHNLLTTVMKRILNRLYCELLNTDEEITYYEQELDGLYQQSEEAQRLVQIPGVGQLTAMALIALVGDISAFKNGRHFSAYLGLVPRQNSSGGKSQLMGISKRGNVFVRTLLIHGARAVMSHIEKKTDKKSTRLKALKERRGFNRACVALANKHARVIWTLLSRGADYDEQLAWQ